MFIIILDDGENGSVLVVQVPDVCSRVLLVTQSVAY